MTLPLCFADYSLFKGKNLYNLQEGKIINSFQGLLDNLDKLTYSSYVCELIDICTEDGEENFNLFKDFILFFTIFQNILLNFNIYAIIFKIGVFCPIYYDFYEVKYGHKYRKN